MVTSGASQITATHAGPSWGGARGGSRDRPKSRLRVGAAGGRWAEGREGGQHDSAGRRKLTVALSTANNQPRGRLCSPSRPRTQTDQAGTAHASASIALFAHQLF